MGSDTKTLILLGTSTVSLILMLLFNALSGSGKGGDIFVASTSDASRKYETYITPAGWAFIIWTPIFLMLALAQVFIIVTFFLRDNGSRLINKHGIATPMFLGIVTFNYLLNFTWVFLFDRAYEHKWLVGLSSFTLFVIAITNILSTGIFARNISRNVHDFSTTYAVLYRILLNGYCLYTTWTIIASLINMCQAIAYIPIDMINLLGVWTVVTDDISRWLDFMKTGAYTGLSLLVIFHVCWFIIENFVFDSICRWILTPYCVVIWASSAVYDEKKGFVPKGIENFTLAIIIIGSITLAIRLGLVVFKTMKG